MEHFKRGDVVVLDSNQLATIIRPFDGNTPAVIAFHSGTGNIRCRNSRLRPFPGDYDWQFEARRVSDRLHAHRGVDASQGFFELALAGEIGEVCNVMKKLERDGANMTLITKLAEELADVRIYLFHLVRSIGLQDPAPEQFDEMSPGQYARYMFVAAARMFDTEGCEYLTFQVSVILGCLQRIAETLPADLDAEIRCKFASLYTRWPEIALSLDEQRRLYPFLKGEAA
jgi:hypothetical protein